MLALTGHRKFFLEELIQLSGRCWVVNSISSENHESETSDVNKQEALKSDRGKSRVLENNRNVLLLVHNTNFSSSWSPTKRHVGQYSTVEIMQARTDEATMEDHEEIAERPEFEAKAGTREG